MSACDKLHAYVLAETLLRKFSYAARSWKSTSVHGLASRSTTHVAVFRDTIYVAGDASTVGCVDIGSWGSQTECVEGKELPLQGDSTCELGTCASLCCGRTGNLFALCSKPQISVVCIDSTSLEVLGESNLPKGFAADGHLHLSNDQRFLWGLSSGKCFVASLQAGSEINASTSWVKVKFSVPSTLFCWPTVSSSSGCALQPTKSPKRPVNEKTASPRPTPKTQGSKSDTVTVSDGVSCLCIALSAADATAVEVRRWELPTNAILFVPVGHGEWLVEDAQGSAFVGTDEQWEPLEESGATATPSKALVPVSWTEAHPHPAQTHTRLLLRLAPSEGRLTRSKVRSILRGHPQAAAGTAASPQLSASQVQRADVQIQAHHPHDANVTINSEAAPVEATIQAEYFTEDDETEIIVELVDVQRLVSVRLSQRIRIAEERRRHYENAKSELDDAWVQLKDERSRLSDYQKRLSTWDSQLDNREQNVESAEDDLNARVDTLNKDITALRQKTDQLNTDRENLAKEREVERELEIEAERRRRADREKQRQHERQMDAELKKQEKAVEGLHRATEEKQMAQGKLERELARIARERDQHRRDAQWARDKEQEWNRERTSLERRIRDLQDELAGANATIDSLNGEMKGQRQVEAGLRDENAKQQCTIEYYEGRGVGEADTEWVRRRDAANKSLEASKKGTWHHTTIQIDSARGTDSATVAFALGSVEPVRLMKCAVSIPSDGPLTSGTIDVEIGEGFVVGDLLSVDGIDADGQLHAAKGVVASSDGAPPSDLLSFTLMPGVEASLAVATVLNSLGFVAANPGEFGGVRAVEFSVNLSTAKQSTVAVSGRVNVAVIPSAFDAFRDPIPFTERAPAIPVFGHVRLKNPFSDLSTRSYALNVGTKFFSAGIKGPNRAAESSTQPSETFQAEIARKHASTVGRRCLTCAQPRLSQKFTLSEWSGQGTAATKAQEGMFADFELIVSLDKVQPEDRLQLDAKEVDALRQQLRVTINAEGSEVLIKSIDRLVPRDAVGSALQSIQFSSDATPLDEAPRALRFSVRIPHMPIPLEWTATRSLTIVNAAHHVKVSAAKVDRTYRTNTSTVSGVTFPAPRMWFADEIDVSDPFASKFRGEACFTLHHPTLRVHKDMLGIAAPPALDTVIVVDSCTVQDPPPPPPPPPAARWGGKSQQLPTAEEEAPPPYVGGTVLWKGVHVASFKLKDSSTRLILTFTPKTTSDAATDVLRSVFFESEDTTPLVRRSIKCDAALGRGSENVIDFTVTSQMPIVAVERLGGMKWTEHQGPMPAAAHFGLSSALADTKPPPAPEAFIHVFVSEGFEKGDVLAFKASSSTKEAPKPKALFVRGTDWASRIEHSREARGGLISAFHLDDGSVLLRIGNSPTSATTASSREVITLNDVSLIKEALQHVTYEHTSSTPSIFRKVLCARSIDFDATYSDACVPLNVVPIDDPTEIHDLPKATLFCQGSREALHGFRVAPNARVVDPDTDDFIGGTLMIEPTPGSYVSSQDQFFILSPEQQREQNPSGPIVFVDERNRIHVMPSFADFVAYEGLVREDIVAGPSEEGKADDGIPRSLVHSVGLLTITDLSDQFTASPGSAELSPQSPSKKKKEKEMLREAYPPSRWEVFFKPPRQRTISLECVQTILRCFAWQNNSGRMKRRSRRFTVTLGAGALGAAVNVEGAQVAEKTVLEFSVKAVPGVFFVPQGAAEVPYQRNGGAQPVSKALMVLPLSPYVKVHRSRLVVKLAEPLAARPLSVEKEAKKSEDDESISLALRRDAGMELRGDQLVASGSGGSTSILGTVSTMTKACLAIDFNSSARIDAKQLQTIVRSVTYNCSSGAKEVLSTKEVRMRDIEIALENALHFTNTSLPSSSDDERAPLDGEVDPSAARTDDAAPTEMEERPKLCSRFTRPVDFACRLRVQVSTEAVNATAMQQMGGEAPFSIVPPERPLEYTMRCGASQIFNAIQTVVRQPTIACVSSAGVDRSNPALLRPPAVFVVSAPAGVSAPLQFAEDAIVSTAPLAEAESYALPRFTSGRSAMRMESTVVAESSADLARSALGTTAGFAPIACVEVRFNGTAVALMTTASKARNALQFEFLACPPSIVGELLRRVSFMGGGKKDRAGAKHVFKCTFCKGPGHVEDVTVLTAVVTPPYVEEIVGSAIPFSGPASFPFINAKIKSTVAFGGGRLAVDIAASDAEEQRISAADRIFIADADVFKAEYADDDQVNGVVRVAAQGGRPEGTLGVFTLTAHSFMLRIADDPTFASGDLLQAFIRGCLAVGQVAPVPKGAPPPPLDDIDYGVSYACTLQLEDAALVGCETSVVVSGAPPKKKKAKK